MPLLNTPTRRHPLSPRGSHTTTGLLVLLTVHLAACKGPVSPPLELSGDQIAVVRTDTAWTGPAFVGTIASQRIARVRAESPGTLLSVSVDPGQSIAAGTVLATFDDRGVRDQLQVARSAVTQADAVLAQSTRELERVRALIDIGALAVRDREVAERAMLAAQSQHTEVRARLATAEYLLQRTVVRAPFDAVVTEHSARAGDVVAPGMPLFTLADQNRLGIEALLSVATASTVNVGAMVQVSPLDEPSTTPSRIAQPSAWARITWISRMVDVPTRQVRVGMSLPTDGARYLVGQTVHGRLALDARVGLRVPERAIDHAGDTTMVARIRAGRIVRTVVTLGPRDEETHLVEILAGLAPGDSVVIGDERRTADGVAVRTRRGLSRTVTSNN